jgi:hypothetical protein
VPELGDIPPAAALPLDFATRSPAAMTASRTVLIGSVSATTETIPASHA